MFAAGPSVLNIHAPSSSFAIIHSLAQESLVDLYDKLSRKAHTEYHGERVCPGWLKYEYNDAVWNLDDDSDYTIFVWRQKEQRQAEYSDPQPEHVASTSRVPQPDPATSFPTPTLHLHNPGQRLPEPPAYCNASYYLFQPSRAHVCHPTAQRAPSRTSKKSGTKGKAGTHEGEDETAKLPKFKQDFERFHSENGVRTVIGSIGPVQNVRMLLKSGHRHVYISRKFAVKHGFIPPDAAPGNYGYGGLVNIGAWPITLTPSASSPGYNNGGQTGYIRPDVFSPLSRSPSQSPFSSPRLSASSPPSLTINGRTKSIKSTKSKIQQQGGESAPSSGPKPVSIQVYLSEEPHFDVVLGRSFIEKRQIKTNSIDPTDVWCLDTGEKIECELVILKDGRGEIVTVT